MVQGSNIENTNKKKFKKMWNVASNNPLTGYSKHTEFRIRQKTEG